MSLIDLNSKRQHYTISTPDGNAHVIPKSVFDDIAKGKLRITDIDDYQQITRAIIWEWQNEEDDDVQHYGNLYGLGEDNEMLRAENAALREQIAAKDEALRKLRSKAKLTAAEINDICENVFDCSADMYDLRVFDFARAVEQRLAESAPPTDNWIDVSKRLPEYGKPVLIVINGIVQHVTYFRDGGDDQDDWFETVHYEDCQIDAVDVTHWMPLPSPPTRSDNQQDMKD